MNVISGNKNCGNKNWLGSVAACALIACSGQALAGGFAPREQSAEAQGASFAGVAAGAGGLSAMFWNPATMTNMPGWQSSWTLAGILPYSQNTPAPGTPTAALGATGNQGGSALLPASYASYQFNDQIWVGLALNTPFGLGTKNQRPSAPQLWGLTTTLMSEDINPNIAFKVNEWISIGVGLQVMYFKVRQTQATAPVPAPNTAILSGDSWGVGFTGGITLKPMAGTEIGIGYRSMVRQNIKGNIVSATLPGGSNPVGARLDLPEIVTIGLRQRIAPQFTLLAGFEWSNWRRVQQLRVTSTGGLVPVGTVLALQNLNYKNGWMVSGGGEYQWTPQWTFRAGLAYEKAPLDDSNRGVTLLDSDRIWTSIGASYKYNQKLSFDFAYSHVFVKSGTVNIPATVTLPLPYTGTSRARVDILSVGLNYRWDDPKVAAPIFAKH